MPLCSAGRHSSAATGPRQSMAPTAAHGPPVPCRRPAQTKQDTRPVMTDQHTTNRDAEADHHRLRAGSRPCLTTGQQAPREPLTVQDFYRVVTGTLAGRYRDTLRHAKPEAATARHSHANDAGRPPAHKTRVRTPTEPPARAEFAAQGVGGSEFPKLARLPDSAGSHLRSRAFGCPAKLYPLSPKTGP